MKNQRKAGVILSYAAQLVRILTALIYTPIMLRILGKSEYGLYQLVNSVVSYLGLLNLGFSASYMRFYSRFKVNYDDDSEQKLNGMFMIIFCIMSAVCVFCGVVMILNITSIFGKGLTIKEYETAGILMSMMVLNLALTFPNSVFTCIIIAHEKFIFQKVVILVQALLNPFLTLPLLLLGYGSIGMVCVTTMLTVAVLISNAFYCLNKFHSKFYFRHINFGLLKEMWHFTFFIFLNQIIDQINWSVDKFLLGRMVGTAAVATYGIAGQLNSLYLQLSTSISSVFIPKVNRIVAESDNNEELTEIFTRVGRIQFIVLILILSGFYIFGKAFIFFWVGEEYKESYYVALFLLTPVTVPLIQNLGIEIQRAKNRHQVRSVVYFFIAIANIVISIPFIRRWGSVGAATGTMVSLIVGNGLFMNWYYYFCIGIDVRYYWKNIFSVCRGLIIPLTAGYISFKLIVYSTIARLCMGIIVYTLIYCIAVYSMGMNQEERELVKAPLLKLLTRLYVRKQEGNKN